MVEQHKTVSISNCTECPYFNPLTEVIFGEFAVCTHVDGGNINIKEMHGGFWGDCPLGEDSSTEISERMLDDIATRIEHLHLGQEIDGTAFVRCKNLAEYVRSLKNSKYVTNCNTPGLEGYPYDVYYIVKQDGDKWVAHDNSFENLQKSDFGFGDSPKEALAGFIDGFDVTKCNTPIEGNEVEISCYDYDYGPLDRSKVTVRRIGGKFVAGYGDYCASRDTIPQAISALVEFYKRDHDDQVDTFQYTHPESKSHVITSKIMNKTKPIKISNKLQGMLDDLTVLSTPPTCNKWDILNSNSDFSPKCDLDWSRFLSMASDDEDLMLWDVDGCFVDPDVEVRGIPLYLIGMQDEFGKWRILMTYRTFWQFAKILIENVGLDDVDTAISSIDDVAINQVSSVWRLSEKSRGDSDV